MENSEYNLCERVKDFITSASSPGIIYFDPLARDPALKLTDPQLPGNATYSRKSVQFTVPQGKALHIKAAMFGIKAHSVFLSLGDYPGFVQLYKGEANSEPSRSELTHYIDPRTYSQVYLLTTASKDTPGRESQQPWWNNHPLGAPRPDSFGKLTTWETDDSRDPGMYPNVTVTWYHPDYNPQFVFIS